MAGGFVAMALGCVRFAQSQRAAVGSVINEGPLSGFHECIAVLDKHPDSMKQAPSSWFLPNIGVTGTEAWSKKWLDSIREEKGYFLFRDTNSMTLNHFEATAWIEKPMMNTRLL